MQLPAIHAIGTAVPPHKIAQHLQYSILESANGMSREEKLKLRLIYGRSCIAYRHSVLPEFGFADKEENIIFHPANHHPSTPVSLRMELYDQYAAPLCRGAIQQCFAQLPEISPQHITHLITFSCTGMSAPGLDIQLVHAMNLNKSVERTCINFMGCYAAINALKSAYYIAAADPDAVVLIAGVELCTLHYRNSENDDQMLANALFADGAAAAVISKQPLKNIQKDFPLGLKHFYSEFDASGNDEMVWKIGETGFDIRLSAYVPDLIRDKIGSFAATLFSRNGLRQKDVDFYALHPGGIKILEACETALHIPKEENTLAYDVLKNYGNMSSVTILFVLQKCWEQFSEKDKNKLLLGCAFGPGLTMEAMILQT